MLLVRHRPPPRPDQLALRAAGVAVLCAGAIYALSGGDIASSDSGTHAPVERVNDLSAPSSRRTLQVTHTTVVAPASESVAEPQTAADAAANLQADTALRIQEMLAQRGCPGWIAAANHPEWLEPASYETDGGVVPLPPVSEGAQPTPEVPRLTYPAPLRVAALPTPIVPDDDTEEDDLLGGVDDLVMPSAGGESTPATAPTAQPAAPSEDDSLLGDEDDLVLENEDQLFAPPPQPGGAPLPRANASAGDDNLLAPADDLLDGAEDLPRPPGQNNPAQQPTADAGNDGAADGDRQGNGSLFRPPPSGTPNPHVGPRRAPPGKSADKDDKKSDEPQTPLERCEFVAKSLYPAATECRTCHEQIYDEWSMSSHAYAMVSPMFHKFEQTINDVAQGTIGYFCYRCHSPAGTSLGISRAAPLWDLPQVAREGVTCVACHRVNEFYGRTNGERRIVPGDLYDPVYGSIGGAGVAEAIAKKDHFKLKTSPDDKGPGQAMHRAGFYNPQLGKSDFCITCHQVAVYPGIKLEVVWEQYRASPACKKGIRCQDCHMGRIPGVPSGFEYGPAAVVNKKKVNEQRRHSNHVFYGPGYSIAHPGVFPFNPKAYRWTMREWLLFDWRAGWGTDEFEDAVKDGRVCVDFPEVWKETDDRADAREIIDDNLKKRAAKDRIRSAVMENGSHVDGPFFQQPPTRGQPLQFNYVVVNTNEGHNLPTASLGAQPQLWANVALIGPRGNRLWESGYLDSLGDLADIHSVDVRNKRLAFDSQLFNLQTMFLITGAKGTDREFYLPVNVDFDQLPFIRPGAQPITVINHPPFIRMEARSLAPLGSRRVPYRVPAELMCEPGRYRLTFRMRSRLEPLYFMRFCKSTPEMMQAMNDGILDFHQSSVEFIVR